MKICSTLLRVTLWLGMGLSGAAASQPSYQTWVSGTGKDTGSCTLAAPCATFQYAQGQTIAGGTIFVATSGSYGVITITKSLNIIAPDGVNATISTSTNTTGVHVNANGGSVFLRGIRIAGQGGTSSGYGIEVDAGNVTIDHVTITNTFLGVTTNDGFTLITHSVISGNDYGIDANAASVPYLGETTVSGNSYAIYGQVNSYGDNDMNGNIICDICKGSIHEIAHDQ